MDSNAEKDLIRQAMLLRQAHASFEGASSVSLSESNQQQLETSPQKKNSDPHNKSPMDRDPRLAVRTPYRNQPIYLAKNDMSLYSPNGIVPPAKKDSNLTSSIELRRTKKGGEGIFRLSESNDVGDEENQKRPTLLPAASSDDSLFEDPSPSDASTPYIDEPLLGAMPLSPPGPVRRPDLFRIGSHEDDFTQTRDFDASILRTPDYFRDAKRKSEKFEDEPPIRVLPTSPGERHKDAEICAPSSLQKLSWWSSRNKCMLLVLLAIPILLGAAIALALRIETNTDLAQGSVDKNEDNSGDPHNTGDNITDDNSGTNFDSDTNSDTEIDEDNETLLPTMAPFSAPVVPTAAPTIDLFSLSRNDLFLQIICPAVSKEEDIKNPSKPHYDAFQWLVYQDNPEILDPKAHLNPIEERNGSETYSSLVKDRFIVALLYFATNGGSWRKQYGFLSGTSVCDWNDGGEGDALEGVLCKSSFETDEKSVIEEIVLDVNKLEGSLPTELGRLTTLRKLSLGSNSISGSIPTELGLLYDLKWLGFGGNYLIGELPKELGSLKKLERLFVCK